MKKHLLLFLVSAMVFLTSCGSRADNSMTIRPSEFSEQTQTVLEIIGDDINFYDYTVDETIKSVSVNFWKYENGVWVSFGSSCRNIESREAQLAVRANDYSYDVFDIGDNGHSKISQENTVKFAAAGSATQSRLSNPTAIEPGKEITLWSKLGYDTAANATITTSSSSGFREAGCDSGFAITITFSTESVE